MFIKGLRLNLLFSPYVFCAILIAFALLSPILAVFITALGDSGGLWPHLFQTVLPKYVTNTLVLMGGVSIVALTFGLSASWVVFRYKFIGRNLFEWLLLLPAAVPAYLIAYVYTDFLEFSGPLQGFLRELFGWQFVNDYWFPEIRSMEGAMLVIGTALYPYVYVLARTAFYLTPASFFEIGILMKRSLFWSIGLPLARPAIVAGLALVLMETISDFGTVEFFAVETLTLGIFNVWLGMNNLPAAAQIASITFLFIIFLLVTETYARSKRKFSDSTRRSAVLEPKAVKGMQMVTCWLTCSIPILIGFILPVGILASFVLRGFSLDFEEAMLKAAFNSLILATTIALVVVILSSFLGYVYTFQENAGLRKLTVLSSIGYAFPGTILAIGVVTAGGFIDSVIAELMLNVFGISYLGILTGGLGLVIFACVVRFQAVGFGAVMSGIERLPLNIFATSRVLGSGFGSTLGRVFLPLISSSILAGGLLVFVDVMKELPMTLLLRPFNFETLATYVYQFAKDELLEEAALPALIIILVGIGPILLMNSILHKYTQK